MENVLALSGNSSKVDLWWEYTILSGRSWRRLILLLMVRECSIQINGQYLNWDLINALNNILLFSKVMNPAMRPNAVNFLLTLLHIFEIWFSKFNSESIDTPNSVSIWLDLTETPPIFVSIEDFELNNRWHFSGFALRWFFSNQLKSFSEVDCSSEITVGVSLAHV